MRFQIIFDHMVWTLWQYRLWSFQLKVSTKLKGNNWILRIFCYWHFLIASIFESLYFLKWCLIFDISPLTQFSKFNDFLWVCWFLGKNLSDFVSPACKLDKLYYHNLQSRSRGDRNSFFRIHPACSWFIIQNSCLAVPPLLW